MYLTKNDGNIDLEVIVQNLCNEMPNNIINKLGLSRAKLSTAGAKFCKVILH